ncbi:SH3 and PX domain-containing protein 2B-like [Sycon ciliatum]|uniref:SH3 and PX domain-containing protein 2B-like n=1 Tax=Sycon ciliatum TaxID=27933 RepID=UPI0020A8F0EF|eukprot:scpid22179/ scgid14052/ SH3 and PX domain-containing protein 2B; Adapter protein HOFI; Factor for adipocyte differentiation 49; Tyrosine kinase substrate with four SH3 domains
MSYTKRTVTDVHVVDVQKRRRPTKHYVYVISVSWSEGSKFSIFRSYSMLLEFQAKLQDLFAGQVPSLPGRFVFGRGAALAEKRRDGVSEFCKHLLRLSTDITKCDDFLMFFEAWPEDATLDFDFDANLQSNAFYVSADSSKKPGPTGEGVGDETDELEPYRAVSTWTARSPREISFISGDKVEVIEKNLNGWWVIVCGNREGVAPASYLEPLNHLPEDDKAEEELYSGVYVVSIDFRARKYDEITLEVNTTVDILEKTLDGWWKVRANGREGLFPSTFLKKMSIKQTAKSSKGHPASSITDTEGEATYGVLVNPPPRRQEIEDVDSIYSSIESLKREAKGPAPSHKPAPGGHESGSDSDSDIFEYAEFAPSGGRRGGGGGGNADNDDGPEYSEIRQKIHERMGNIHQRKDSQRSANKPEHKPQRLSRAKATRRQVPADVLPPLSQHQDSSKRTTFSEERSLSQDSVGSTIGGDDVDLYQVKSAYRSEQETLNLHQGDFVEVDDIEDGWAYVRLVRRDKKRVSGGEAVEGWAPAAFLQLCPKRKPKPNRPPPTLPENEVAQQSTPPPNPMPPQQSQRKVPRSDSGPAIVHQSSKHKAVRPSHSLNDDVIPINISNPEVPSVYVNTQSYVNVPGDGRSGEQADYASASTTSGTSTGKSRGHIPSSMSSPSISASVPSSGGGSSAPPEYVNTAPLNAAGTPGSSSTDSEQRYVNTGSTAGSNSPASGGGSGEASEGDLGETYVALCDYNTMAPSCLSFKQGDIAILLQVKGQGWWKVKCNGQAGWVPASYWEKELLLTSSATSSRSMGTPAVTSAPASSAPSRSPHRHATTVASNSSSSAGGGSSSSSTGASSSSSSRGRRATAEKSFLDLPMQSGRASPSTGRSPSPIRRSPSSSTVNPQVLQQIQKNIGGQAWFHGKISRKDAEEVMTRDGNNGDYIIRESTNRVGDFALTVVYNCRVRHFPIEVTMDAKVLIGKHRFESMNKIIQHYKECPLFLQDGAHISLGMPFKKRK